MSEDVISLQLNPPLILNKITLPSEKTVTIVRNDFLLEGTKQRALYDYISVLREQHPEITELVYVSAFNGFARYHNIKATIFVTDSRYYNERKLSPLSLRTQQYEGVIRGANYAMHVARIYISYPWSIHDSLRIR
jgi:hypothetical protein